MQRQGLLLPIAGTGLLLVLGTLLWGLASVHPMVVNLQGIHDDRPKLELLRNSRLQDLVARIALKNALTTTDPEQRRVQMERFADHSRQAAALLGSLEIAGETAEGRPLLAEVVAAHIAVERARAEVIAQWRARGETAAVPRPLVQSMEEAEDHYIQVTERLRTFEKQRVDDFVERTGAKAVLARLLLAIAGAVGCITLVMLAMVWKAQARAELGRRDAHIAQLREQRSALVREVHHRIKNHLQGLLGLVEDYGKTYPAHGEGLATLQGHVLALVGIHGLQATQQDESVLLADLLRNQVRLIEAGFPGARIHLSIDERAGAQALSGERAVMLALSVAELIVNAFKHGTADPIIVELIPNDGGARVAVTNRLAGVTKLDWEAGKGFGTGLSLVSSLMRDLGRITQEVRDQQLTMTLTLPLAGT